MNPITGNPLAAWKAADFEAMDAEGLLRVQVLKYAEGISGPPAPSLMQRAEQLRRAANDSLRIAMDFLGAMRNLRHADTPHAP